MMKTERYKVGKEDWDKFAKTYADKGYVWSDNEALTLYNPFNDDDENVLGNEEYVYILFRNKEVLFEFEDGLDFAEEDVRLFKTWSNDCYFCMGKEVVDGIRYLDLDGDLVQAENDDDYLGFEGGKAYLFTENKVIEAKFCPVCGDKIIE